MIKCFRAWTWSWLGKMLKIPCNPWDTEVISNIEGWELLADMEQWKQQNLFIQENVNRPSTETFLWLLLAESSSHLNKKAVVFSIRVQLPSSASKIRWRPFWPWCMAHVHRPQPHKTCFGMGHASTTLEPSPPWLLSRPGIWAALCEMGSLLPMRNPLVSNSC